MQLDLFESEVEARHGSGSQDHFRIAKAGEYFAAFELMVRGANVTVAAEGLPYDLLADYAGRIARVQVKTASMPREAGRYVFNLLCGSHKADKKSAPYTTETIDVIALVAADIRKVAFVHISQIRRRVLKLSPADFLSQDITSLTFAECMERL